MRQSTDLLPPESKRFLRKYIVCALIVDIIGSLAYAVLNSTLTAEAAGAFGFSGAGSTTITILTGVFTFGIAMFIGAVFMTILSIFGAVAIAFLYGGKDKEDTNPPSPGPNNPCLLYPDPLGAPTSQPSPPTSQPSPPTSPPQPGPGNPCLIDPKNQPGEKKD
jgi:hypothetical protein